LDPKTKTETAPIQAEASLLERLSILAQKKVIVGVSAKVRVQDRPVKEGQLHPQAPLLSGAGILKGIENRPLNPSQATPLHVAEQTKSPEFRAALGGTGRAALLPEVSQGADTRAKAGYTQPSSGFIIEPKMTSFELEVVSWNTSIPKKSSNISHAETQFVEWFASRGIAWKERVVSVEVQIEGRPICEGCLVKLNWLKASYPWVRFDWHAQTTAGEGSADADKLEVD
jgi:hypothetical protein